VRAAAELLPLQLRMVLVQMPGAAGGSGAHGNGHASAGSGAHDERQQPRDSFPRRRHGQQLLYR
jgi:hypothetical protein